LPINERFASEVISDENPRFSWLASRIKWCANLCFDAFNLKFRGLAPGRLVFADQQ
jgi:hypothetical protein